jgi:hypothetical protein
MKLRTLADTISTYLTLVSALILPVVLVLWVRSYLVSDRYYHAEDGLALVTGVSNGELSVWAAPTRRDVKMSNHRARQAAWGWSQRRTFERVAGRNHVWFAGFAYARADAMPWRNITLTGRATGVCIPLWFPTLLVGALPFRLIARNMQSSADFLAQRAAEAEVAARMGPTPDMPPAV